MFAWAGEQPFPMIITVIVTDSTYALFDSHIVEDT